MVKTSIERHTDTCFLIYVEIQRFNNREVYELENNFNKELTKGWTEKRKNLSVLNWFTTYFVTCFCVLFMWHRNSILMFVDVLVKNLLVRFIIGYVFMYSLARGFLSYVCWGNRRMLELKTTMFIWMNIIWPHFIK